MALIKQSTDKYGYEISYWRINPIMTVDFITKHIKASVLVYKDETARSEGKSPNPNIPDEYASVELNGTDFTTAIESGDVRTAMYTYMKSLSFFQDATDNTVAYQPPVEDPPPEEEPPPEEP